jgi:hypothetical protein
VLTPEEQAAVNDLSSHIEVSSSRAVVTYHWSDFRHDPKQVLLKYFDAYFYLTQVQIYWQMVARGVLLIIAVTLDSFRRGGGYR